MLTKYRVCAPAIAALVASLACGSGGGDETGQGAAGSGGGATAGTGGGAGAAGTEGGAGDASTAGAGGTSGVGGVAGAGGGAGDAGGGMPGGGRGGSAGGTGGGAGRGGSGGAAGGAGSSGGAGGRGGGGGASGAGQGGSAGRGGGAGTGTGGAGRGGTTGGGGQGGTAGTGGQAVGPNADPATRAICTGTDPIACHFGGQPGNYDVTVVLGGAAAGSTIVEAEALRAMLGATATAAGATQRFSFTVNVRQPEGEPIQNVPAGTPGLDLYFRGSGGMAPRLDGIGYAAAASPFVIYIAGDSTVCDQTDPEYGGWGQQLPPFFNYPVSVANYADSGEARAASSTAGRCSAPSTRA